MMAMAVTDNADDDDLHLDDMMDQCRNNQTNRVRHENFP